MEPSSAVFPSPDGRFVLEIFPVPMRMSHEVDCPTLYDAQSRTILFDPGSLWDASDVEWSENSQHLTMQMRHYDNGTQQFSIALDLENQSAALTFGDREVLSGPFSVVGKAMEQIVNMQSFLRKNALP